MTSSHTRMYPIGIQMAYACWLRHSPLGRTPYRFFGHFLEDVAKWGGNIRWTP